MQATDFLKIPRAQIETANFELPADVECELGLAMTHDGGYALVRTRLRFIRPGRQPHEIVFESAAPSAPLMDATVRAQDLLAAFNNRCPSHAPPSSPWLAIESAANRAYTAHAKL